MTVAPLFPECPHCQGKGWTIRYGQMFDPPEQEPCEKCGATGFIDPAGEPDNSEPMGAPESEDGP